MQACPRIFRMALVCLSRADSTSTACERRANNVRVMVRGYASTSCSRSCVDREGVHSRVCSPARRSDGSQPRNWVRRVSPNGESGDARNGTPALARAYMHISACGAIRAHTHIGILPLRLGGTKGPMSADRQRRKSPLVPAPALEEFASPRAGALREPSIEGSPQVTSSAVLPASSDHTSVANESSAKRQRTNGVRAPM